ncbi:MAG TPA: filamentous hemagglutinin N-terminal domain-containing protein, partial [Smithellaceae bacterium]|nr:filamentous hemagglutinin N-terminal domain-containing protein [Smithellaceae bacterium]
MKTKRDRKIRLFRVANTLVSVVTLFFFSTATVFALPYGQQVVNGQVSFNPQGNQLTITNSPNAIINWQGFSIGSSEAVRFLQQNSASAVLNRVTGQDPSQILGILQSNGRVFLVNPNGILFGQGAKIDVNGLFASTLNISNTDFLGGRYNFQAGSIANSISNLGEITTPSGGKVYLIAPQVENSGIIHAPGGDVLLAAGHRVELVDSFDPNISVVISAPENGAVNLGRIIAESGKIGIYGGLIAQKGVVSANSAVMGDGGKIHFKATKAIDLDESSVISADGARGGEIILMTRENDRLSGTLKGRGLLSAQGDGSVGSGGFIETSAAAVNLNGIRVKTNG